MEYTIAKLARLSGVTGRTLRYYDQIGLLRPVRVSNGYRIYGEKEVDRLQQILFYRELGVELKDIGAILQDPDFNRRRALEGHLTALLQKRARLDRLIENVTQTIHSMKGEEKMSDQAKFKGFKEKMIQENEEKYGGEIRKKYGGDTVSASYAKVRAMSRETMTLAEDLAREIQEGLVQAMAQGDPAGALARQVCEKHRQWLCLYWPDGMYTPAAHRGLADLYVEDERFRAYYDQAAPGGAQFLRDAIYAFCKE
ncbi:MAG: MerR family transcriptional regulator [Eubacteriales bacterium]|nr:MerR family transcriptional regulator [Eubacteriales bacterium]